MTRTAKALTINARIRANLKVAESLDRKHDKINAVRVKKQIARDSATLEGLMIRDVEEVEL